MTKLKEPVVQEIHQIKLIQSVSFIIISISVFGISRTGNSGYEFSIFADLYLLIVLLVVILIFNSVVFIRTKNIVSLLQVIMSSLIFAYLPIINGYFFYGRYDLLTHLGRVHTILETGEIKSTIYPIQHILAVSLQFTTNIPSRFLLMALPFGFFFIGWLGTTLCLREIYNDSTFIYYILFLTPIYGVGTISYVPSYMSFFIIPNLILTVFLYYSTGNQRFKIVLLIFLLTMIFLHPLTLLFALGIICVIYIGKNGLSGIRSSISPARVLGLSLIIWFLWYFSFSQIKRITGGLLIQYLGSSGTSGTSPGGTPILIRAINVFADASPRLVDIIQVLLFRYGTAAILGIISLLYAIKLLKSPCQRNKGDLVAFGLFFISVCIAIISSIVNIIIDIERTLKYTILFATVLSTRFLTNMHSGKSRRFVHILIVMLVFVSVFTMYPSPEGQMVNRETTEMEYSGAKWLLSYSSDRPIESVGIQLYRFDDAINGIQRTTLWDSQPPPHFNYSSSSYTGYTVITTLGQQREQKLFPNYPESWRYNPKDFNNLENPPKDKIYTSDTLTIYSNE